MTIVVETKMTEVSALRELQGVPYNASVAEATSWRLPSSRS